MSCRRLCHLLPAGGRLGLVAGASQVKRFPFGEGVYAGRGGRIAAFNNNRRRQC